MSRSSYIVGQYYRIHGFTKSVTRGYKNKLLSMGFMPGAHFLVMREAPFGDTLQIQINDFSLSLRAKELAEVIVEPMSL